MAFVSNMLFSVANASGAKQLSNIFLWSHTGCQHYMDELSGMCVCVYLCVCAWVCRGSVLCKCLLACQKYLLAVRMNCSEKEEHRLLAITIEAVHCYSFKKNKRNKRNEKGTKLSLITINVYISVIENKHIWVCMLGRVWMLTMLHLFSMDL